MQTQFTVAKLLVLVVAMFAFALWVMPPLYNLFCEVTGFNSKYSAGKYEAVEVKVDTSRTVRVKFIATNNEDMPWSFVPESYFLDVHPGEAVTTKFLATNPSNKFMVGQAVPTMNPSNASDYFHKTECFCFNSQVLAPGETADLGLQFIVDQDVPKGVNSIILSYTLFDVSEASPEKIEQKKNSMQSESIELDLSQAQSVETLYALAHE